MKFLSMLAIVAIAAMTSFSAQANPPVVIRFVNVGTFLANDGRLPSRVPNLGYGVVAVRITAFSGDVEITSAGLEVLNPNGHFELNTLRGPLPYNLPIVEYLRSPLNVALLAIHARGVGQYSVEVGYDRNIRPPMPPNPIFRSLYAYASENLRYDSYESSRYAHEWARRVTYVDVQRWNTTFVAMWDFFNGNFYLRHSDPETRDMLRQWNERNCGNVDTANYIKQKYSDFYDVGRFRHPKNPRPYAIDKTREIVAPVCRDLIR